MTDIDTRTVAQPRTPSPAHAPWLVRVTTPMTNRFMRLGLPTGPNVLLTVRGRTSGLLRTAPIAVVEIDGRRYVIGAYGDVQWVRNLRAAGEASIRLGRRDIDVTSRELGEDEALTFFTETLPGYIRRFPAVGRVFARVLFGLIAPQILSEPARAATTRPVFELETRPGQA